MIKLLCTDSIAWLESNRDIGAVFTSFPDMDDEGMTEEQYRPWSDRIIRAILSATSPTAPAIFYQTDRKHNGQLLSKAERIMHITRREGYKVLWHKIALRRPVGSVDVMRPGYTHLIAVSLKARPGKATPDVLEDGEKSYRNAMGDKVARFGVEFVAQSGCRKVVDPFCGHGTVLKAAQEIALDGLGIDIDEKQIEQASKWVSKK